MYILDRSRYTECCEIDHIFRTNTEDLTEKQTFFERNEHCVHYLTSKLSFLDLDYPTLFNNGICDLHLLQSSWHIFAVPTVKHYTSITSYSLAKLLTFSTFAKTKNYFNWNSHHGCSTQEVFFCSTSKKSTSNFDHRHTITFH